MFDCLTSAVVI